MLLSIAMADAYGAGFEFAKFDVTAENTFLGYRDHNMEGTPAGRYTDDTQMSLAVALTVLEHVEPTAYDFARSFLHTFKRDPRVTYARRFLEFLVTCRTVDDFVTNIRPDSTRSGAAMRAGPVGLYANLDKVLRIAEVQARVTHDTAEGVATAQVVASAVHYNAFVRGSDDAVDFFAFLNAAVPGYAWDTPWTGTVSVDGIPCVRAALTAYSSNTHFSNMVRTAVDFTGDTDTVCAIAAAIASMDSTYQMDAPDWMRQNLEAGPFGLPLLTQVDDQLRAHYHRELVK